MCNPKCEICKNVRGTYFHMLWLNSRKSEAFTISNIPIREYRKESKDFLYNTLIEIRNELRYRKDYALADKIRKVLLDEGYSIKDLK